jgi:PEGA domain-containing protein
MFLKSVIFAAAIALAVPAFAQEEAQPAPERQAVPRGTRPQGDNPRMGTAVRRESPPPATAPPTAAPAVRSRAEARARDNDRARGGVINRGSTVIVNPPPVYNRYYYYPRRSYPYGYGAFGLGYFYYDPYQWYPGYSGYSSYSGYSGYGPGYYPRYGSGFGFDIGELRLQVFPRNAQVFVDGYYAGTVDDYDGTFQALKLEAGPYQIRISAPGFEDLMFDVRINPGQKINYKGELRRRP